MTVPKAEPKTLRDAHEVVMDRRPPRSASPSVWLAFRLGNARLYKAIADVDRGHHHEALYWAGYEERQASELQEEGKATD
ncbi:AMED_5909 family protein [Amycolatopsis sp. NPDC088138]|uniref:AMED_5909 family protein n=1 Tax=Amycolatopsis sp. NPDC088138 TaxID=3363938 RepID=UPI0037F906A7